MSFDSPGGFERGFAAACNSDGEFRLAARYWNGAIELDLGDRALDFSVRDGVLEPTTGDRSGQAVRLIAPPDVWQKILAPTPPPFFNDIMPATAFGLTIEAESETLWQYYPAVRRMVDLLREERNRDGSI